MSTEPRKQTHPYDPEGLNTGSWPRIADDALITPVAQFFTRSHAAPPAIDLNTWRLEVDGLVERPARYSLDDLAKTFAQKEVASTLVCAGMRRAELLEVAPLPGELPWQADAASTGVWSGIALCDVLEAAGVKSAAKHVEFIGLDRVERHGHEFGFGGSIDLHKALTDDVLLATHLNGAPLPSEHGFPMRVVVPGWIGARQVKWLGRINVKAEPSDNYFQTNAYRVQREPNPNDLRDVTSGIAMTTVPLNAVMTEIAGDAGDAEVAGGIAGDAGVRKAGNVVAAGVVTVRGWAMGTGGGPLHSIEVTTEGSNEWVAAHAVGDAGRWTWTFWQATLELPPGEHVLVARAADATGGMPSSVSETWNVKGYGNNAWHRVRITVR